MARSSSDEETGKFQKIKTKMVPVLNNRGCVFVLLKYI